VILEIPSIAGIPDLKCLLNNICAKENSQTVERAKPSFEKRGSGCILKNGNLNKAYMIKTETPAVKMSKKRA
jgi:hypothetical protein